MTAALLVAALTAVLTAATYRLAFRAGYRRALTVCRADLRTRDERLDRQINDRLHAAVRDDQQWLQQNGISPP